MLFARPEPRDRRAFLRSASSSLAFSGLALTLAAAPLAAQEAGKVSVGELMAKGALPDIVQGKDDAPVTMIEYASMTCTHCAHFNETVYPTLLKTYVDTGKVRFILREFPLDPLATAGFMLARCEGPQKRTAVVDLLFSQQKNWAFVDKPLEALSSLLKQTGMSQEGFDACLKDQTLYADVNAVRDRASQKFGINATPTFFVNGAKVTGEVTVDSLAKILDPLTVKKS